MNRLTSLAHPSRLPGPKSRQLARRLRRVESRNITYLSDDFPVFWESAAGSWVRDVDGTRYLDLTSAFGVAGLGHGAPCVQRAIVKQSQKMWHGMGDVHPNAVKVQLLEALSVATSRRFPLAILSSSGAEAVESALKTARLATGKKGVIAFDGAYHGLSYGTLGLCDREDFRNPFQDQLPAWCALSPFPDELRGNSAERCLENLERLLKQGKHPAGPFGAIIVEPVQGRGGVRVAGPVFLRGLRALARRYQLLLIDDEIFSGTGRTGRFLAVDHFGVDPDLVCVGKALTNGFPLSACLGTRAAMDAWPPSDGEAIHTSTFLGHPLGCAMALATLKELRAKKLAERASRVGKPWLRELQDALADHPCVGEVRGLGLMIGIELVQDKKTLTPAPRLAARVVTESLKKRLIVLSGGVRRNVLTLTPPLTISGNDLKLATHILCEVLFAVIPRGSKRGIYPFFADNDGPRPPHGRADGPPDVWRAGFRRGDGIKTV